MKNTKPLTFVLVATVAFVGLNSCTETRQSTPETPAETTAPTTEPASQPAAAPTATELAGLTDQAGEGGFDCRIGYTTVARRESDSLYRSVDETGHGLEILTVEWISYARYTGELESDASPERQAIVEKLQGNWGTWGQPDTITLEELPVTPGQCLEWVGFDWAGASDLRYTAENTVDFDVTGEGTYFAETYGDGVTGTVTFDAKTPTRIRLVATDGTEIASIALGGDAGTQALEQASTGGKPGYVDISQEEYFALVGG